MITIPEHYSDKVKGAIYAQHHAQMAYNELHNLAKRESVHKNDLLRVSAALTATIAYRESLK